MSKSKKPIVAEPTPTPDASKVRSMTLRIEKHGTDLKIVLVEESGSEKTYCEDIFMIAQRKVAALIYGFAFEVPV